MIWFLKWVTVEPTFPKQFFQGVLEKLLFENNIPLKILAKIGFKNLNIFFKINNAIIEDEESKNKAPSLYQKALERKKKLDEIKALSNMLQKSKYLGINHDANYISPLFKSGCGETVKFYLMIENNIIKSISFESSASMLTVKSIDLLCNICENKSIDDIKNYSEEYFLSLFNLALSGQRKQDAVGPFEVFKNWIKEIA